MSKLYICNKALSAFCFQCKHSTPHERMRNPYQTQIDHGEVCTKWGECKNEDGKVMSKVRCVEYKGEEK